MTGGGLSRPQEVPAADVRVPDGTPGFGQAIGWGRRPAVLVIDFTKAFTDPDSALGSELSAELSATRRLLDAARGSAIPVLFTAISYTPARFSASLMVRKVPAMKALVVGSPAVEVDPRLAPRSDEAVFLKEYASAFSGTTLAAHLATIGVDTLVIAGCSTSGCVRATSVDAAQHGIRALVVRDCVGDRWPLSHDVALAEIGSKYADVIEIEAAVAGLAANATTVSAAR